MLKEAFSAITGITRLFGTKEARLVSKIEKIKQKINKEHERDPLYQRHDIIYLLLAKEKRLRRTLRELQKSRK